MTSLPTSSMLESYILPTAAGALNATHTFLLGSSDTYTKALAIINRPLGAEVPAQSFDAWGHHWEALYALYPSIFFTVMFFSLRMLFKYYVFPPVARLLGLTNEKVVHKFAYQGWLLAFYITSTLWGHYTLRDKPWVAYPLSNKELHHIDAMWRTVPEASIAWYYSYQIGFFVAELYAICVEPKRSDFIEYLVHHFVTLALIGFSWVAYEHRAGSYVLIIHDVVDIFLCLAKIVNYLKARDAIMVPVFAAFTVSYAFFRMYCLPILNVHACLTSVYTHPVMVTYIIIFFMAVCLQGLHVFWFGLILRIVYRAATKGPSDCSDVRSDDDEDENEESGDAKKQEPANPKKKKQQIEHKKEKKE